MTKSNTSLSDSRLKCLKSFSTNEVLMKNLGILQFRPTLILQSVCSTPVFSSDLTMISYFNITFIKSIITNSLQSVCSTPVFSSDLTMISYFNITFSKSIITNSLFFRALKIFMVFFSRNKFFIKMISSRDYNIYFIQPY